ncbi:MAG: HD domain-containing protein [Candidatus Doudnabacteria bacterium]
MNNYKIIKQISQEVRNKLDGESSGHDWWHVYRVWQMARHIGRKESANMLVVELAALLHDISDWKFNNGDDTVGPKMAKRLLLKHGVDKEIIDHVCEIMLTMSYKGAGVKTEMRTLEGKIVQDADRLDAIGAIGIGRTFAYGGHANLQMHNPDKKPVMHKTKEEYFKNPTATINHFYEKLLLLKDRMNTKTAKKLAVGRHEFMKKYLERFYKEWKGLN